MNARWRRRSTSVGGAGLVLALVAMLTITTAAAAPAANPRPEADVHLLTGRLSDTSSRPYYPASLRWSPLWPVDQIASQSNRVEYIDADTGPVTLVDTDEITQRVDFQTRPGGILSLLLSSVNKDGRHNGAFRKYSTPHLLQEDAATYSAGWATTTSSAWSGGAVRSSSGKGQTATVTFEGHEIALISRKAADLGAADLYLDGAKVTTFNAKTTGPAQNLLIVSTRYLKGGSHTLAVVVKRGRVDIDGFLIANRYQ